MDELARYLLENIIFDFKGEVTTETVRSFLRKDNSEVARTLLQKVIEEDGIEELLIAVADCLTTNLAGGIDDKAIREHLINYSES